MISDLWFTGPIFDCQFALLYRCWQQQCDLLPYSLYLVPKTKN